MLADVFEAIIGAIYIDSDDFITTRNIVLNIYKSSLLQEKMIQDNQNRLELFYSNLNFKLEIHNHLNSNNVAPGPSFEILTKPNSFTKALLQVLEGNNDDSFRKYINKSCNNLLIDYEINDISTNFANLITSENIKSYIYFLSKFVKEYYYSFHIKSHYICSKILLSFLTLSHHSPNPFISFTTIFGLTHNGISEFFRKNFEKAKEYFDFAINIIKEKNLFHPETNLLLYYFYNELDNNQNIDYFLNLVESDNSIKAFLNSEETCYTIHGNSILLMMKYRSLANKLIDKDDKLSLCKLYDDLLEKLRHFSQNINNLIHSYFYYNTCLNWFEIKKRLNLLDVTEVLLREKEARMKMGEDSIILMKFYNFYVKNNIERESLNSKSGVIENLLHNYTLTSRIIIDELINFSF